MTSAHPDPRPHGGRDVRYFAVAFRRAGAFRAGGFFFGAGAFARRSASNSEARSSVICSTLSPLRRLALVSPSVTYGPNRPSLITIGFLEALSAPSSRSGGGG